MTRSLVAIADGKAATIVSPTQLAINLGKDTGVEVGDIVYVRRSVNIQDPDGSGSLGILHQTRLRLKITTVADGFSVATVTEPAPRVGTMLEITRVNRTKTIAEYDSQSNESAVWVVPGEPVAVLRMVETEDEEDHGA